VKTPAVGEGLSLEKVIALLQAEGGTPRATASPGSQYYQTAKDLRFVRCECSYADPTYGCHEYIARNYRGTCYYVGYDLKTGNITCGPKGFHYCRQGVPECI
jgi:hypothetical protein